MQVIHLEYPFKKIESKQAVAAIGYFDGLHLGHQGVIRKAIQDAAAKNVSSALITFHPHPREILKKDEITNYITPLEDKLSILRHIGVDFVYVIHFTWDFSQIAPHQFVEEVLLPLGIIGVVVGFDFHFGKGGSGSPYTLRESSNGRLAVHVVEPIQENRQKISSSSIRQHLLLGEIEQVNRYLGRPFFLRGIVTHGSKRGREIGFPTANITLADRYFLPQNGVYGVRVEIDLQQYFGVMNIGVKPTFETQKANPTVEIHLLDFIEQIYGKEVQVEILFHIRAEQKFAGIAPLKEQIMKDIVFAKEKFLCYTV